MHRGMLSSSPVDDYYLMFLVLILYTDPRWFEQAEEFIPERWSSQPELIHNKNAFSPFLIGSYSCVGKNLAFLEMRLLTYYIVKKFSFEFPPGADKDVMGLSENSKGFRDFFCGKGACV